LGRLCRKLILFNLDLQMSQNNEIDLKAFLFIKTYSQKIVFFDSIKKYNFSYFNFEQL